MGELDTELLVSGHVENEFTRVIIVSNFALSRCFYHL